MQELCFCISLINLILIVCMGIVYFKNNYVITTIEQWNELANFYNKHHDEYDENDKPIPEEKTGGFGFMCYADSEDDEDYEDKSKKK